MSSHHIVREKQEPALLVLGMDTFSGELLGQLLEWSPTIVATELTAEQFIAQDIKVDLVVGNSSSDQAQSNTNYLPIKNNDVIGSAFEFLLDSNYGAVNVVTDDFDLND